MRKGIILMVCLLAMVYTPEARGEFIKGAYLNEDKGDLFRLPDSCGIEYGVTNNRERLNNPYGVKILNESPIFIKIDSIPEDSFMTIDELAKGIARKYIKLALSGFAFPVDTRPLCVGNFNYRSFICWGIRTSLFVKEKELIIKRYLKC